MLNLPAPEALPDWPHGFALWAQPIAGGRFVALEQDLQHWRLALGEHDAVQLAACWRKDGAGGSEELLEMVGPVGDALRQSGMTEAEQVARARSLAAAYLFLARPVLLTERQCFADWLAGQHGTSPMRVLRTQFWRMRT